MKTMLLLIITLTLSYTSFAQSSSKTKLTWDLVHGKPKYITNYYDDLRASSVSIASYKDISEDKKLISSGAYQYEIGPTIEQFIDLSPPQGLKGMSVNNHYPKIIYLKGKRYGLSTRHPLNSRSEYTLKGIRIPDEKVKGKYKPKARVLATLETTAVTNPMNWENIDLAYVYNMMSCLAWVKGNKLYVRQFIPSKGTMKLRLLIFDEKLRKLSDTEHDASTGGYGDRKFRIIKEYIKGNQLFIVGNLDSNAFCSVLDLDKLTFEKKEEFDFQTPYENPIDLIVSEDGWQNKLITLSEGTNWGVNISDIDYKEGSIKTNHISLPDSIMSLIKLRLKKRFNFKNPIMGFDEKPVLKSRYYATENTQYVLLEIDDSYLEVHQTANGGHSVLHTRAFDIVVLAMDKENNLKFIKRIPKEQRKSTQNSRGARSYVSQLIEDDLYLWFTTQNKDRLFVQYKIEGDGTLDYQVLEEAGKRQLIAQNALSVPFETGTKTKIFVLTNQGFLWIEVPKK